MSSKKISNKLSEKELEKYYLIFSVISWIVLKIIIEFLPNSSSISLALLSIILITVANFFIIYVISYCVLFLFRWLWRIIKK